MTVTPLCRQCGSVRTREVRGQRLESFLARLLKQRVIACGRCGWQGRMKFDSGTPASSRSLLRHPSAPPIDNEGDEPDLASLDKAMELTDPSDPTNPTERTK